MGGEANLNNALISRPPRALSLNPRYSSIHVAIKICLGKVQRLSGICRS
jgi:hypothetical protein